LNITFSDIYQPLFDLLEARKTVNNESFCVDYNESEQKYWQELASVDTVLISGGRDSGKSFALSCWNPIASADYNHRILYTRQTMSSTDNSITEALENRMESLGYDGRFTLANKIYSVNNGVGKISITGQKTSVGTQTAKLKSLEDFSVFETDEGEELESYDNWKKVKRSMRAKDVQTLSIIVFNPPTVDHWLYSQFYEEVEGGFNGIKDNVLYIHSTYLDNGKENMTEANWNEYEDLRKDYELYLNTKDKHLLSKKIETNYKEYKYNILGGFRLKAEGTVITNWSHGEFNPNNLQVSYGQDYGFSNDPTTLVAVAIDKKLKKIYVKELLYKPHLTTTQIADINKQYCGRSLIVADSAEPRLINEISRMGCNVTPVKKPAGSISAGVMLLQDYEIIVEQNSHNIVKEFNNHIYADKGSKTYKDTYNHLIDSIRYNVYFHLAQINRVEIR
jgi:phage terminase large subunit